MVFAKDIYKSYESVRVLKGVSLNVDRGEIVSIVGASGAGKSTLLHILGSLDTPDSGTVEINGILLHQLNDSKRSAFRNGHIGFVFQFHHLLQEFTALENVCLPAFIAGKKKKNTVHLASELLEFMGLMERLDHKPSELSGGEQQRVAVARALINQPDVILADEPSGNLDSSAAMELHRLFFNLRNRYSQTYIIVTHNTELAAMTDRKLTIRDGIIK